MLNLHVVSSEILYGIKRELEDILSETSFRYTPCKRIILRQTREALKALGKLEEKLDILSDVIVEDDND